MIIPITDEIVCTCPDPSDIALSKMAAWREKDVAWLRATTPTLLDVIAMRSRLTEMPPGGPGAAELSRRMAVVETFAGATKTNQRQPAQPSTRTRKGLRRD